MNRIILHKKENGSGLRVILCIILISTLIIAPLLYAQTNAISQKGFSSPEEAVNGLIAAVRAQDTMAMLAILGQGGKEMISSGDAVADKTGRDKFLKAYDEKNSLQQGPGDKWVLSVGNDNWPMPVPIVKKDGKWLFDPREGKQEILNRRIGRNELQVMDVLHAYVDAQHEYAIKDCSGGGKVEFAQRIISTKGRHDGLYWETAEGEEESPLGPLVAQAAEEGYSNELLSPFHGYYFKILKGQGSKAEGGAYNYVVNGKMILGFAILAYPAEYKNSGVMTFIVNQEGIIYEKNLGSDTREKAEGVKLFNPDQTWKQVKETEE
ncbi:MAG: DUF2950 domain-containing protein [Nitrospirae bacterium]|nr:DUF2950 domain-containing protein [Nitrospirota bacterium]